MNINSVVLAGNLTRDPEMRYSSSGTAVCSFGIANNEKYGDKETTHFVDVTAFGKTGEVIGEHFNKGKPILIEGKLDFQSWETDSGDKRSKLQVIAKCFHFVGAKESNGDSGKVNNNDIPF